MSLIPHTERFTPPKELPDQLEALGISGFDHKTCRILVKAMRGSGYPMMRKKYVKPVDAVKWLVANPMWAPYQTKALDTNQLPLFPEPAATP